MQKINSAGLTKSFVHSQYITTVLINWGNHLWVVQRKDNGESVRFCSARFSVQPSNTQETLLLLNQLRTILCICSDHWCCLYFFFLAMLVVELIARLSAAGCVCQPTTFVCSQQIDYHYMMYIIYDPHRISPADCHDPVTSTVVPWAGWHFLSFSGMIWHLFDGLMLNMDVDVHRG